MWRLMSSDAAAGGGFWGCGRAGVWWCDSWIAAGGGAMALTDSCEAGAAIAGVVGITGCDGQKGMTPRPRHLAMNCRASVEVVRI